MAPQKGTIAIEEAVLNPAGVSWIAESAALFNPSQSSTTTTSSASSSDAHHGLTKALLDIHQSRLAQMDAHGVEYMLLSLTSPGAQGEPDPAKARALAAEANDWLAAQVSLNPARFGAFASVSMHNAADAIAEARRAVQELGMFGVMLNDYQVVGDGAGEGGKGDVEGKRYYDEVEFREFWKVVEELGVPVYLHPRYPPAKDLQLKTRYGERKQILGAAVQFHLDLSMHVYALCSSGVFDEFPRLQVVIGHLGEG
jgi:2,3-dihydroxybenzoate decarboxylase